jgi:hypothetical protein
VLYNYVANILLDRVFTGQLVPVEGELELIASRRETNKFLNENFKQYISNQVSAKQRLPIKVVIKSPHEEKCLQIADFACWAIYRKREYGDDAYWQILKEKIFEESPLFP